MPPSTALEALRAAAAGFRRRSAMAGESPLAVEISRLMAWLDAGHHLLEPIPYEQIDLTQPLPAGQRVLLAGDKQAWHVRMPGAGSSALPQRWSPQPSDRHLTRQCPQELVWHPDRAERRHRCGALATLRFAASGDGDSLIRVLQWRDMPAAAALVRRYVEQDSDRFYALASGGVPREAPSPARLLAAAFADRPEETAWLRELCAPDDWDSGPGGLPVPRGQAVLPGQSPAPATWISLL